METKELKLRLMNFCEYNCPYIDDCKDCNEDEIFDKYLLYELNKEA